MLHIHWRCPTADVKSVTRRFLQNSPTCTLRFPYGEQDDHSSTVHGKSLLPNEGLQFIRYFYGSGEPFSVSLEPSQVSSLYIDNLSMPSRG